jgi:hypothetical protein
VKESGSRVINTAETGQKTKSVFHPPKIKKGLRTIPLPKDAVSEFKHWRAKQSREKLLLQVSGFYIYQGFVFIYRMKGWMNRAVCQSIYWL